MKFVVEDKIFDKIENLYVGIVIAKGIDNSGDYPNIGEMLQKAIKMAERRFLGKKVKEDPRILPYREAFTKLGINPNKFQCSVEALFTRISKGKKMPSINPLVDLNNAVSLKYNLPMGTHDLGRSDKDIEMRYAHKGDTFRPMGTDTGEIPDEGEVVYAVGDEVRTRRWAWRQSEYGKIDAETNYVFFPIDGFRGINDSEVDEATQELSQELKKNFGCKTTIGFVDREHPIFEWEL